MEINSFFFQKRLIFLFLFFFPSLVGAEVAKLPLYGKGNYVAFSDLKTILPELSTKLKKFTRVGAIFTPQGTIHFRIGSSFYTLDGKIQKVPKAILKKEEEVYLPLDLVEAVFLNLISYDVRYQFKEGELWVLLPKETVPKRNLAVKAIIIDAGHGGKDPGTSDPTGYFEKEVSLGVARYTYLYLRKYYPEIRVEMVRKDDRFVELEDRSKFANQVLRDTRDVIFISFHCNASLSDKAAGFEVYYLSQSPSTEAARETALLENRYIGKNKNPVVSQIQSQMLSSVTQRRSKKLADAVANQYEKGLSPEIPSRGVKKADFSVLRGSLMPAVLVEMGYLTNPEESKRLRDKSFQKKIARSVIKGIHEYASSKD
ncbi:N-acetylmuramoyl-L-alanine amidase [Leptospira biflexa]|uniref:N-acetylmuramoyl-L-alanine amidase family protein n=1 Tax=Leptospira biflexa TaxID=172 RepID=UPI00108442E3|nr:N-acetylmuramoyl-L-alanine amidase [Leptospira biflexa]TGM31611.1 N-acetylmuramoyl-L-alanine amidase [Leptospira biflexa]TGM39229.1 N-acetylmuramoyl-L-alanine amidase [Leptospira biflexa]TGM44641.1 N-acetylmuramoyl-L-alanine amidase [Leptospira biflexa]TGM45317.1 N-acetylmuramoyl-L-alanine amidase [Leptospira biflexa]TGM53871.1 N-acetylmuramoyl-L-alanine amidase [Leptospira biflexa]